MFREILALSLDELIAQFPVSYLRPRLQEKVSVSLYTRALICNGDCQFCGWNKNFIPQEQEKRELTPKILQEHIVYAQKSQAVLELMDNSIAVSKPSIETYGNIIQSMPSNLIFGVNPGICLREEWLRDLFNYGVSFYGNNLETSPRLFSILVKSHNYQAKIKSLELSRKVGLRIHSGFILGLPGETEDDYLAMLTIVNELQPDVLNLNFFFPIDGLSLAKDLGKIEPEVMLRIRT